MVWNGPDQIDLAWTAPADDGGNGITGYKIQVSVDAGVSWRRIQESTGSVRTNYSHTGVSPGIARLCRVSAINDKGKGRWSRIARACC